VGEGKIHNPHLGPFLPFLYFLWARKYKEWLNDASSCISEPVPKAQTQFNQN